MPPDAVYVGRGSRWGNPFRVGEHGTAQECVELFALCLYGYLCISTDAETYYAQRKLREAVRDDIGELEGRDLACWCSPDRPCHADVLLQAANLKILPAREHRGRGGRQLVSKAVSKTLTNRAKMGKSIGIMENVEAS